MAAIRYQIQHDYWYENYITLFTKVQVNSLYITITMTF